LKHLKPPAICSGRVFLKSRLESTMVCGQEVDAYLFSIVTPPESH